MSFPAISKLSWIRDSVLLPTCFGLWNNVQSISLLVLTIFAMWHLEWEKACARDFLLPPSMLYFGPAEIRTHFRFIFDSKGREFRLSQVVTRAWETVSELGRQLMLFCWSGLNNIRHPQNCRTHSNVNKSSARATQTEFPWCIWILLCWCVLFGRLSIPRWGYLKIWFVS